MRKLLLLVVLAGAVRWALGRRRTSPLERVAVGYADGSALELASGAPELDRMLLIARGALRP